MKGNIKFVAPDGTYGFIAPDDGSVDAHFKIGAFVGPCPRANDKNRPVEFDSYTDNKGVHAVRIKLLDSKAEDLPAWANPSALGRAFGLWASLPQPFIQPYTKTSFPSALHRLAAFTLAETWHFGSAPPNEQPYPILWNYLRFTFVRHCKQDVLNAFPPHEAFLRVSTDGNWATFNTGLVTELYDPIFALFKRRRGDETPPWELFDFCVPGQGQVGKDLAGAFNPLPEPPKYFRKSIHMLLDPDQPIHLTPEHVIVDGIKRDRFPFAFLRQNLEARPPKGLGWEDYSRYQPAGRKEYLERLACAINDDPQTLRSLKNRLEDAKDLAVKRVKWNYKTAIPQYYPRSDDISLLLPMCLVDDERVDIALVVKRLESDAYQAYTVFPLEWGYQNARLVCRPDSDWLMPERLNIESLGIPTEELETEEETQTQGAEFSMRVRYSTGPTDEELRKKKLGDFARAYKIGDLVEGTVQNLANYGVFVDLPAGATGLLHVSKISHEFVQHPRDRFSIGERVKVKILNIDEADGKIELSSIDVGDEGGADRSVGFQRDPTAEVIESGDELAENGWSRFTHNHGIGDWIDGIVQNLKPYGALVELSDGIVGLVHISEIKNAYVKNINDELVVGQRVHCRVLKIDQSKREIALSLCAQIN